MLNFLLLNYLTSTVAPTSSSLALSSSASSFATPSLIALGALSTMSLASLSPSAVISRTPITTLILEASASSSTTSHSVCASAASPSPAAPAAATGAAADTPNSSSIAFTISFRSKTVISLFASIICCLVMIIPPFFCFYHIQTLELAKGTINHPFLLFVLQQLS